MASDRPMLAAYPLDAEALYRAHAQPLFGFIFSKVRNREVAEDLTSDVFVKAMAHLDPTREAHSIAAWFFRVARNAVADYWRTNYRTLVTDLEEVRLARRALPAPQPAARLHAARRACALLDQLPERYRVVLSHRVLEGLSLHDTAQLMGISEGNVKVLQYRALKCAAEIARTQDPGTP